jgi:SAM-dependent methyltransferase
VPGAGSIAQWLTQRVGAKGKVLAADLDTRFLSRLNISNLEVRKHDILNDDLETGHYDLVHSRFLLMHLHEPEKALKRMADALRPGGWMFLEELDCGYVVSTDITDPAAASFTAIFRTGFDFLRKRGIMDCYFGRRVRGLIENLGFVDVGHEGVAHIYGAGDIGSRWGAMTVSAGAKPMIAAGLFTQAQIDEFNKMILDPNFQYPGNIIMSAWGKKPS